ncbi:MAG: DNA-3-methyladenine glycosylase I [Cocleimonas sp.]
MNTTFQGSDGETRCYWCEATQEYIDYHDDEWGFPVSDDFHLFEKLSLESFQSGLSWRTILVKRENFRTAFDKFDFNIVADYAEKEVEHLLNDEGIVRHRGKIEATINNAKVAQKLVKEHGSLAAFLWQYEPKVQLSVDTEVASTSEESIALSKDLKKLGWKFLGPTTAYAFMQSVGMVNDHFVSCVTQSKVESARKSFKRPSAK